MRRAAKILGLGLAVAALAACASSEEKQAELALACQVKDCICQSVTLTEPAKPVLWRDNGEAYCEKGFQLQSTERKKDFKFFYGG